MASADLTYERALRAVRARAEGQILPRDEDAVRRPAARPRAPQPHLVLSYTRPRKETWAYTEGPPAQEAGLPLHAAVCAWRELREEAELVAERHAAALNTAADRYGCLALHHCAYSNARAEAAAADEGGKHQLRLACHRDAPELLGALLDAGADPRAADADGATPLRSSSPPSRARSRRTVIFAAILAILTRRGQMARADFARCTASGASPLGAAVRLELVALVEQMLAPAARAEAIQGYRGYSGAPPETLYPSSSENFKLKHEQPGTLFGYALRYALPFFIAFKAKPHPERKPVVFDRVVEGMDVVKKIEARAPRCGRGAGRRRR
eukprot:tig00000459_g1154.t1